MTKKDIIDAWAHIRTIDQTISDEVLDFMKDAAIEKFNSISGQEKILENIKLADSIKSFIDDYARLSPNYEPEFEGDIDGKYTGPDVYELLRCADDLIHGKKIERCWSEFGSGCYLMTDQSRKIHEYLMEKINQRIKEDKLR